MSILPIVLNFSGSDTAGLAGVAMDVRTQTAMGVHSASVITANTAQNNQQVISINAVEDTVFNDQVEAVKNLSIKVIKVGLVGSIRQCENIHMLAKKNKTALVVDPVLGSSSGENFIREDFIEYFKKHLFSSVTLLTPNIPEAELLTGVSIKSKDDMVAAAKKLLGDGVSSVLIKGGHFTVEKPSDTEDSSSISQSFFPIVQDSLPIVQDYFSDGSRSFWLSNKKIMTENTRGTGCALASAIASALALDYSIYDAVVIGKMAISQGLRQSYSIHQPIGDDVESGSYGPVNITHFPNEQVDLPVLTQQSTTDIDVKSFPECNHPLLGLYPVVDRAEWISTLAPVGISTIQLRTKDLSDDALENEIERSVKLATKHNCRLFVNDYWELAIKYKAYGVHLGQEDLDDADMDKIKNAGLRLGISTHCHYEVARAHSYRPSYIACGPVYHTTTKDMPWVPHGLKGLSYWRQVLNYPLVAIGGINRERFDEIAVTGADSIAMITAITLAADPVAIAREFIQKYEKSLEQSRYLKS